MIRAGTTILTLLLALTLLLSCTEEQDRDPEGALREILAYQGTGALATRKTFAWVDRIVSGGPAMLGGLEEALRTSPDHDYHCPCQVDHRAAVISNYRRLRIALLEAVARIGGDRAVTILKENSTREGHHWEVRTAANLYLVRFSDREDVRRHFEAEVRKVLVTHRDDPEAVNLFRITRGRLPATLYGPLAKAIAAGWPAGISDEVARTAADLKREEAGQFFLKILEDPKNPITSRVTVARALGRMPERRNLAVALVLKEKNLTLLANLLRGLRVGRYGNVEMMRAATESGAPADLRKAWDDRKRDLETITGLVTEIAAKLDPAAAKKVDLPALRQDLARRLTETRNTLKRLTGKGGK